jgi:uncharacterized CHY-type Zn-finger protein
MSEINLRDEIKFNCPECLNPLTVDASGVGRIVNCPECSKQIKIPNQSIHRAQIIKKSEFAGAGALVQILGVLACFTLVGIIIGIPLLIIGSNMSKKFLCGDCRNKLTGKDVRVCPVCKASLR